MTNLDTESKDNTTKEEVSDDGAMTLKPTEVESNTTIDKASEDKDLQRETTPEPVTPEPVVPQIQSITPDSDEKLSTETKSVKKEDSSADESLMEKLDDGLKSIDTPGEYVVVTVVALLVGIIIGLIVSSI